MKTARTILPILLLTLVVFGTGHTVRAQTQPDLIYIEPEPIALTTWEFSYTHRSSIAPVNQIVLWIDTTAYPNVRFGFAGIVVPSTANDQDWESGSNGSVSNNGDSAFWCNESYSIAKGVTDSWFDFQLVAVNANIPIYDSAVVIHWYVNTATDNTCTAISSVSSGELELIPTEWQGYPKLDTVTGTATVLADCDPSFHFTVFNRSTLTQPIDHMVFSLMNPYAGTIRPSEAIPPAGWVLDSATQLAVYFETSTNAIPYGGSLGGFNVGLRAPSTQFSVPFVWSAYNGGGIMDRDTTSAISVTPCSGSTNSSDDTLRATNNLGCGFNFNLENSHAGEANLTVSPINKLVLQITTTGVTWASATPPPEAPQFCWSYTGLNTQTLSFQTPTASCEQPAGLTWIYGASIDDPNSGETVTIQWSDFEGTTEISSGTTTIKCIPRPTPDSVSVIALGDCEYRVIVKNSHVPASGVKQVLFTMPTAYGTFAPPFSSNANWASSLGGDGLEFTASGGTGIKAGATDTFYFSINPKQPNSSWPLTFIDYDAVTGNTVTDTTIKNVVGCTLPVVLDSIFHHIDPSYCTDTITIINRGSDPIDSIEVVPGTAVSVASATISIPWSKTLVGDSAILASSAGISPESPKTFIVSYTGETANASFPVAVRTMHTSGPASTNDTMLSCSVSGVVSPQSATTPLTLSIAPNPLRDRTDITLTTGTTNRVQMTLLNVLGQTEQTVVDQTLGAGEHTYSLDATALPAGTYYLRLETDGQVVTKKLAIEK